jgi:hypothetical protein
MTTVEESVKNSLASAIVAHSQATEKDFFGTTIKATTNHHTHKTCEEWANILITCYGWDKVEIQDVINNTLRNLAK